MLSAIQTLTFQLAVLARGTVAFEEGGTVDANRPIDVNPALFCTHGVASAAGVRPDNSNGTYVYHGQSQSCADVTIAGHYAVQGNVLALSYEQCSVV
jgi:hypothetical protein